MCDFFVVNEESLGFGHNFWALGNFDGNFPVLTILTFSSLKNAFENC